jgi:acyl-CoA thioesterase FadM
VSGFLRNFLTLLQAWLHSGASDASSRVVSHFWVLPWDAGLSVLKSDKYLQFAEAAQLDYVVKTRLLRVLLRDGLRFVNAAQLVKFTRPIGMFKKVRVETSIIYADGKCAYFSHSLFLGSVLHGEVLVKMKFKKGSITVPPGELISPSFAEKPSHLVMWDRTLEAM